MISILILMASLFASQQDRPVTKIHFGHGGGITGAITTCALHSNGDFFKVNVFADEQKLQGNIGLEKTNSIFKKVGEYEIADITLNKPGNTYRFVALYTAGEEHRITWSGNSENKELNLFYTELTRIMY